MENTSTIRHVINPELVEILNKEHAGKWVALSRSGDKLIASAETFEELREKVGDQKVTYWRAPEKDVLYAF